MTTIETSTRTVVLPTDDCWMEQRGLAASTIDRRLSTVCGFYRFAHIDGRIGSSPAQYVLAARAKTPWTELFSTRTVVPVG
jgi:site-specific recombinase XerD